MTNIYPTSWQDTMVPPTQFTTGGTALIWDEIADGIYGYRFDVGDKIHFNTQFPHSMKVNSIVKPHMHLLNKLAIVGAGIAYFEYRWKWANMNTQYGSTTTDTNRPADFTDAGALKHYRCELSDMTPTTGQGNISSIVLGSIERLNTGYVANNIFLLGFDIHFEADTIGSFGVVTK